MNSVKMNLIIYFCFIVSNWVKSESNIFTTHKTGMGKSIKTINNISKVKCATECMMMKCLGFAVIRNQCVIYSKTDSCDEPSEGNIRKMYMANTEIEKV